MHETKHMLLELVQFQAEESPSPHELSSGSLPCVPGNEHWEQQQQRQRKERLQREKTEKARIVVPRSPFPFCSLRASHLSFRENNTDELVEAVRPSFKQLKRNRN